jgi:Rho family protein
VRVVLTALKCDLRKDEEMNDNPNTISFDQGLAKAKEIGAVKYLGEWMKFIYERSQGSLLP